MIQKILQNIGLTDKEISVYLAALELGPQPASVIANKARLNRSTTYVILTELLRRGLMSRFNRADIQHYAAAQPEALVEYTNRKQREYEQYGEELKDILLELKSLTNPLSIKPRVRFYDGEEGVKTVMEDTLTSKETLLCYSSLDKWLTGPLNQYIRDYGHRRVYEKKILLQTLVHSEGTGKNYYLKEYPKVLSKIRFIPKDISIFDNEVNIYGNKVSIVSLTPNQMFGIIIESQEIADTQKSIFKLAWKGCGEYTEKAKK